MTLGNVKYLDNWSGIYTFVDKKWIAQQELFEIMNLEEKTDIEKRNFNNFWGAQSPYSNWERSWVVKVTNSLINLNKIKWYVESILLHELSDYDDTEDSMLQSEIFVIKKIQNSSTLKPEEKANIIKHHIWFFQSNKTFYEELFTEFKKYYQKNQEKFEEEKKHYDKICKVVEYLEWLNF